MTVSTIGSKIIYAGTGAATTFSYHFAMPAGVPGQIAAQLRVTYVDPTGVSTVVAYGTGPFNFQLDPEPPVPPNPTPVGGVVTYAPGGTPIPVGSSLTIERLLPDVQSTSLENQGTLWQPVIEGSLDYLTMLNQQILTLAGNILRAPETDPPGLNYVTPSVAARANTALIFDSQGNLGAGTIPTGGVISAAMAPVVSAATLPAARTAMGLGNIATQNIGPGLQASGATVRVDYPLVADIVDQNVTAAFHLTQRVTSGVVDYFLPLSSTLWNGFGFWIFAQQLIVLHPNAADSIAGAPVGQVVPVPQDSQVWITTNGTGGWWLSITQQQVLPGGYLTLQRFGPLIPLASIDNATSVWYRAGLNNWVPVYTGSFFVQQQFPVDLELALDATNHIVNRVYDIFAFLTGGALALGAGPAWRLAGLAMTGATNAAPIQISFAGPHGLLTGDEVVVSGVEGNNAANGRFTIIVTGANTFTMTGSSGDGVYVPGTGIVASRGNGAGTTQLNKQAGIYTNANSLTLNNFGVPGGFPCPAGQGTYLGSFWCSASPGITCKVAAGPDRTWGLWNAYNRRPIRIIETDPTPTWNYSAAAWQVANANSANHINIVIGIEDDIIEFTYEAKGTFQTTTAAIAFGGGGRAGIWITSFGSAVVAPWGFVDDKAQWVISAAATPCSLGGPQNFHARAVTRPIMGVVSAYPIQSGIQPPGVPAGITSWFGTQNNMLFGARWGG